MTHTTRTRTAYLGRVPLTLTSAVCDGEVLDTTVCLPDGTVLYCIAGAAIRDFLDAIAAFEIAVTPLVI